jgi:SprT protein
LNPTKIHTILSKYLPSEVVPDLVGWIVRKQIHFTVAEDRKSKLGDYRTPFKGKGHRISVNGSLNKYAFLITFLHEIAHLLTFEEFKNRVNPHGKEWKRNFQKLVKPYLATEVFPQDIRSALGNYMRNPAAATCRDENLLRILKNYNPDSESGTMFLDDLPDGAFFRMENGKCFRKEYKLRKFIRCVELETRQTFRVPALVEVWLIPPPPNWNSPNPTKEENTNAEWIALKELPFGSKFSTRNKLILEKGKLLRTNFICQEVGSERKFKANANMLVKKLD